MCLLVVDSARASCFGSANFSGTWKLKQGEAKRVGRRGSSVELINPLGDRRPPPPPSRERAQSGTQFGSNSIQFAALQAGASRNPARDSQWTRERFQIGRFARMILVALPRVCAVQRRRRWARSKLETDESAWRAERSEKESVKIAPLRRKSWLVCAREPAKWRTSLISRQLPAAV